MNTPGKNNVQTAGNFYLPELDGLRFFAFLGVFVTHTVMFGSGGEHHHLPAWVGDLLGTLGSAGVFGVDLFFTLSSFLITNLLLRELRERKTLDIRRFYVRRALRIWPVYILVTALAWLLGGMLPGETFPNFYLFAFAFFAGNWAFLFWPVTTIASPLWSIAIEEQFYLAWPWLVRRGGAGSIKTVAIVILLMGVIGCYVAQVLAPDLDWVTKNSFTRMDGIAIGAVVAVFYSEQRLKTSDLVRKIIFFLSVATLLWIAHDFNLFSRPVPLANLIFGWFLVALACGGILVSVVECQGAARSFLTHRVTVYLGRISYGLYAFHEGGLKIGDAIFPDHMQSGRSFVTHWVFSLALTIVIA